jgi:hypothetical protein
MKQLIFLLLINSISVFGQAVGTARVTEKFFGTSAPGSVTGNKPGDSFTDTTNHNYYICNAPFGTPVPACTSVSSSGWLKVNGAETFVYVGVFSGIPATCSVGQQSFITNASGSFGNANVYLCTSTNTWVQSGHAIYTLPVASGSTLGGIKIGSGLSIDGAGVVTGSPGSFIYTGVLAGIPVSCTVGQQVFITNATIGFGLTNVYNCTASNTWKQSGASGTGAYTMTVQEGTTPAAPDIGYQTWWPDSSTHRMCITFPSGTSLCAPLVIASGTATLGTSAIAANACATVVTATATGAVDTDSLVPTPAADLSAVTGYGKASTDGLGVYWWVSTDTANFKVCNLTGTSITPGAARLNWSITR